MNHECVIGAGPLSSRTASIGAPFGCVIAERETGEVLAECVNDAEKGPILHGETASIMDLLGSLPDAEWTCPILYITAE